MGTTIRVVNLHARDCRASRGSLSRLGLGGGSASPPVGDAGGSDCTDSLGLRLLKQVKHSASATELSLWCSCGTMNLPVSCCSYQRYLGCAHWDFTPLCHSCGRVGKEGLLDHARMSSPVTTSTRGRRTRASCDTSFILHHCSCPASSSKAT